jgi:hypothetical protein
MPVSKSHSANSRKGYTVWIKRWRDPIEPWEFFALSPDEAKVNMARILAAIPWRMRELKSLVRSSKGFENWKPDLKKKSFEQLMYWLPTVVKKRRRTQEEIARELQGNRYLIMLPGDHLDKWLPDDTTVSIAFDCALYFANDLLSRSKSAQWSMVFGKRLSDRHYPVLATKKQIVNTIQIIYWKVFDMLLGESGGISMIAVHEQWVWLLTNKRPKRVLKESPV